MVSFNVGVVFVVLTIIIIRIIILQMELTYSVPLHFLCVQKILGIKLNKINVGGQSLDLNEKSNTFCS